jgi:hypothetical protein
MTDTHFRFNFINVDSSVVPDTLMCLLLNLNTWCVSLVLVRPPLLWILPPVPKLPSVLHSYHHIELSSTNSARFQTCSHKSRIIGPCSSVGHFINGLTIKNWSVVGRRRSDVGKTERPLMLTGVPGTSETQRGPDNRTCVCRIYSVTGNETVWLSIILPDNRPPGCKPMCLIFDTFVIVTFAEHCSPKDPFTFCYKIIPFLYSQIYYSGISIILFWWCKFITVYTLY